MAALEGSPPSAVQLLAAPLQPRLLLLLLKRQSRRLPPSPDEKKKLDLTFSVLLYRMRYPSLKSENADFTPCVMV